MKRALLNPHGWEVLEGERSGLPEAADRDKMRGTLNVVEGGRMKLSAESQIDPKTVAATYLTLKMFEGALNGFQFPADVDDFKKWESSVDIILTTSGSVPPSKDWSVKARYNAYKAVIESLIENVLKMPLQNV